MKTLVPEWSAAHAGQPDVEKAQLQCRQSRDLGLVSAVPCQRQPVSSACKVSLDMQVRLAHKRLQASMQHAPTCLTLGGVRGVDFENDSRIGGTTKGRARPT